MIAARQVRAGRALPGWSQKILAEKANVSIKAITRYETGEADPRVSTLAAIERVLIGAGIEFIPSGSGKGEGVRMVRDKD